MIVYGTSTRKIGKSKVDAECHNCKSPDMFLVGLQRTFDLFWIPTIPLNKSTCIECNSCSSSYEVEAYINYIPSENTVFKTPLRFFAGLVIIAIIIVAANLGDKHADTEKQVFRDNPVAGTYFTYVTENDAYKDVPYSFAKIEKIQDDKIYIRFASYVYSKSSQASKNARKAIHDPEKFLFPVLEEMSADEFKALNIYTLIN